MPFKKGTSGNPVGRPKVSGNNELRNIINDSIDPDQIRDMLSEIEDPIDYINAITKLQPYAIGKKKMIEDIQETDPIDVVITFVDTE